MCEIKEVSGATKERKGIDIYNLPEGWSIEYGRKSRTTGNKRIFILDSNNNPVGASCGNCLNILGVEKFIKNKGAKFGISCICKGCKSEQNEDYRNQNKAKIKDYQDRYRKEHSMEKLQYNKSYYLKNKEGFRIRNKIYRSENRDKIRESKKQYRKANLARFRESKRVYQKQYRQANPELPKMYNHKRRARVKGAGGSYTQEQLKECINFFNGCCAYTGEQLERDNKYHIDHIKAVSKGGTSFIYNLVPATAEANLSKGNKDLETWYKEQPYYSPERLEKIYQWQKYSYNKYSKEEEQHKTA